MATRTPTRQPATRSPSRRTTRRGDGEELRVVQPERPRITVKIEELQDFNESINWCVYGDSGVGKTVFASFAPNAYFLSTEKGVVAAKRVGSTANLMRAPDWDHVEESIKWADKNLTSKHWLIVDSVSRMQELLIEWWLRAQNKANSARDIDIPQLQDHQKWQRMFLRFINGLIEAPYNVIFIATSMIREDPDGDTMVLPNIVGKDYTIAMNFCAAMDIVSCLRVKKRADIDDPRDAILYNDTFPPYFGKERYRVLDRWELIEDEVFDGIAGMIADLLAVPADERKAAKAG